jgi:hypothetical protein
MTSVLMIDRYHDRLHGVLNCYDRVVITGAIGCNIPYQSAVAIRGDTNYRLYRHNRDTKIG